jgi:hypothetical protein
MVNWPNPAGISSAVVSNRTTDHYTQVDCSPFGICFQRWLLSKNAYLAARPTNAPSRLPKAQVEVVVEIAVERFGAQRTEVRFTGGVDLGYFAYGAGGRGFESRPTSLSK